MAAAIKCMFSLVLVGQVSASASKVCAKDSDWKPDNIMSAPCENVEKSKCVGVDFKWEDDDGKEHCAVQFSSGNTNFDGSDLKAACEKVGGTMKMDKANKCSTMAGFMFPSGFTASVAACEEKSNVFGTPMPVANLLDYLSMQGCCGTGVDSCDAFPTGFQMCKTGANPRAATIVECKLDKANCTGKEDGIQYEYKDGEAMCEIMAQKRGVDIVKACTGKGGAPMGAPTTCAMISQYLFVGLKTSKETCEAKNKMITQMTNAQAAAYYAGTGCCDAGAPLCCDDPKYCEPAPTVTVNASANATANVTAKASTSSGTSSSTHIIVALVMVVALVATITA